MRYALIYGAIAGIIIVALTWPFLWTGMIDTQPVLVGYLFMLAGLIMIFVGVKRFRDVECGGVIRFIRALAVGGGIALVASIIYVVGTEAFFMTPSGSRMVALVDRVMMPGYADPLYRMWLTFTVEILPPAAVVTLISAAILSNPRVLPARAG